MSEMYDNFRDTLVMVNGVLSRIGLSEGQGRVGRIEYDLLDAVPSTRSFALIYEDVFYMYNNPESAERALLLLFERLDYMMESYRRRGYHLGRGSIQEARHVVRELLASTSEPYWNVFKAGV